METYELMGCVDCLLFVANGELPEENGNALMRGIRALIGREDMQFLCVGETEREEEFSWSACECCGSNLGGSRHHLVVLRP